MRLALFDLDNTLLAGDSDYEWGQFLVDRGILEREAYEAQNRAYYEQYVAGTLDIHEYLGFAAARCGASTGGWRAWVGLCASFLRAPATATLTSTCRCSSGSAVRWPWIPISSSRP